MPAPSKLANRRGTKTVSRKSSGQLLTGNLGSASSSVSRKTKGVSLLHVKALIGIVAFLFLLVVLVGTGKMLLTDSGMAHPALRQDKHKQVNIMEAINPNLLDAAEDDKLADDADDDQKGGVVAAAKLKAGETTAKTVTEGVSYNPRALQGTSYPYFPDTLVEETHDFSSFTAPGGNRFEEYKQGDTPYEITTEEKEQSDALARSRRLHVKRAMQHAWRSYEKFSFGQDELMPQSGKGSTHWGGMGTTLVDSLDTLWLMGMKEEFQRARDWVAHHLSFDQVGSVSFFETTIRSLGGLLSAYDWSHDNVFLEKAQDLGSRLFHAFDSPSGLPYGQVHLGSNRVSNIGWTGGNAILAEAGTCQLEFRYLSKTTANPDYKEKSEHAFMLLKEMNPPHALYPNFVKNAVNKPVFANNKVTFGAMADSFYEYMLKLWLQGGKTEDVYREMYDESMQGMHDVLLQTSTPSGLVFIADRNGGRLDTKMDHLVCFMGGLLALGAYTDPLGLDSARAQRDLKTAKALTYTCYQMYARMETGIAAEYVQFYPNKDFEPGRGARHYLLRPETVESFFILSYLTGDPVYREWGWEVFQSIERYCKTDLAYGALSNVQDTNGKPRDSMESFFLAETLKYLYLLFDPDTEVDILHKHVFNTEAHPVRIFPVMDQA